MTQLTLLGHSAVAISDADRTLVIDPGVFSSLAGLADAQAVLVTHGHADHLAIEALASVEADVFAPSDVVTQLTDAGFDTSRLHKVGAGDVFTAAGFDVQAFGGEHAEIYPGLPGAQNVAYLVNGSVLHTGDSLPAVADTSVVRHLLLPISAPWLKLADAIDYARDFESAAVHPIHDAVLSPGGKQLTDNILTAILGADTYSRPADGASISLV